MKTKNSWEESYYLIEKSIQDNAVGRELSKKAMAQVYSTVVECAEGLAIKVLHQRVKEHPKLKGKIDDCWLRIFALSLVSYMWASAVSRGKAFDRKRDRKGRRGWLNQHKKLPSYMWDVYTMGEEIVNRRLHVDGDFDIEVALEELTQGIEDRYTK